MVLFVRYGNFFQARAKIKGALRLPLVKVILNPSANATTCVYIVVSALAFLKEDDCLVYIHCGTCQFDTSLDALKELVRLIVYVVIVEDTSLALIVIYRVDYIIAKGGVLEGYILIVFVGVQDYSV
jgi:hypothetical protein